MANSLFMHIATPFQDASFSLTHCGNCAPLELISLRTHTKSGHYPLPQTPNSPIHYSGERSDFLAWRHNQTVLSRVPLTATDLGSACGNFSTRGASGAQWAPPAPGPSGNCPWGRRAPPASRPPMQPERERSYWQNGGGQISVCGGGDVFFLGGLFRRFREFPRVFDFFLPVRLNPPFAHRSPGRPWHSIAPAAHF